MRPVVEQELATLVAFDSVSSRPARAIAAWVAERCAALGFDVELLGDDPDKVNVVATIGPPDPDGLVLSGHLDVVPTEGQPWTSDPFTLTERGDALVGRGTADMKGFVAATLAALTRVDLPRLRRELTLVWTCDEEIGCHGSACVARHLVARQRPLPSACLIGEPTDFRVLRMHPGHVQVHVHIVGRAAHSSRPDLGANAIETAADVIQAIRAFAAELSRERADLPLERPWVVLNVGRIHGGTAINIVPDHCTIELGYRPLPGTLPEAVFARLEAWLTERFGVGACRVHAAVDAVVPPLLTPAGTALARLLRPHAVADANEAAPFATDGGNLARAGCAPLVFGPGSIAVAHQADEHVSRGALARAVDVLEAVIHARCASEA